MRASTLLLFLGAVSVLGVPGHASACGGFFCSSVQMDQAGEDVLYAVEPDGNMTMMVRIVYSGAADDFAWILPVPVIPDELEVGTDALFQQLAASTAPRFPTATRVEGVCRSEPRCSYPSTPFGCGASASSGTTRTFDAAASSFDAGPGVTVIREETVGPYETVILSGGSAEELHTWLMERGYDLPSSSIPLIADYVAAREYFVALRLRASVDANSIQPIVLHMRHDQPCLPIRLTAIATVPDMPIAAYFLAASPAVPINYSLIDPPADDPRLWTSAIPWRSRWADAIDDAGGHAFVMDYAGAPPVVQLELPAVDDLTGSAPSPFFQALRSRLYPGDAQIQAIFERFLEPPAGTSVRDYVNDCSLGGRCPAATRWDPAGLVAALEEEVRAPRAAAQAMMERHPSLTRLFTSMDAEEMTLDPEFRIDAGIAERTNVHEATIVSECTADFFLASSPTRIEMPGGLVARLSEGDSTVTADAHCRALGATGVDGGGCAAQTGRDAGPLLVGLVVVAIAFVFRDGGKRRRK